MVDLDALARILLVVGFTVTALTTAFLFVTSTGTNVCIVSAIENHITDKANLDLCISTPANIDDALLIGNIFGLVFLLYSSAIALRKKPTPSLDNGLDNTIKMKLDDLKNLTPEDSGLLRTQELAGKMMKELSKWKFHFLLLGVGVIIFGACNIIFANNLAIQELGPFYSNEYDVPNVIPYPSVLNDTQLHSNSLNYILTNYNTYDVFAMNNPINGSIEVNVKNATEIQRIMLFDRSYLTTQISVKGNEKSVILKPIPVAEGLGLQLANPNNGTSYFGTWTFTPTLQQYVPPGVLVYLKNGTLESYVIDSTVPPLQPFTEKLQVDANRISVHQTFGQATSNHVIEGLSFIIVGWIPLELWVRRIIEKSREHGEITKIHRLLTSDFSMINRIYRTYQSNFETLSAGILTETLASCYVTSVQDLQSFITDTQMRFDFKFWNALVSSGSFIKLDPIEIKIIQVVHDDIMSGYAREYEGWQLMADRLASVIQNTGLPLSAKEILFNQISWQYLQNCFTYFTNVRLLLSLTEHIKWFDLNSEFMIDIT